MTSSELVRIHQHDRYCFENYLLDEEILFDLLEAHSKNPPESRGLFSVELEEVALSQVSKLVMRDVYSSMQPNSTEIKSTDITGKTAQEVAELLMQRMLAVKQFVDATQSATWIANFVMEVNRKKTEMEAVWRTSWRVKASGKKIIDDLYVRHEITFRKTDLKKEIIKRMSVRKTDEWRVLDQVLRSELA